VDGAGAHEREAELLATTRRGFLKFVLAGSSYLVVGGVFMARDEISAQEPSDVFDPADVLILSEAPYATNLLLEVTPHNRIRFELPRLDKGQGIMTALAMLVADEMDADYDRTDVELSDARADRPYSLTGYSSTIRTLWSPTRTVAAEARARLVTAAAQRWGVDATTLTTRSSMVFAPDGRAANYGELSAEAAAVTDSVVPTSPKAVSQYTVVGSRRARKNARAIVTGAQKYTLDLDLPGAAYAVIARPPTIYGTVGSWNAAAAEAMPNVVGTAQVPQVPGPASGAHEGGIAVAAASFEEAFAARDALQISWGPGPVAGLDDGDLRIQLLANARDLLPAAPGTSSLDASFDYPYINHAPLEPMTAAAYVQADSAEIWFASQAPLLAAQLVAAATGIPEANVTLHVVPCGGSFGRHLFQEAPVEAAIISQALGVPIKLMWSRSDDMRSGRFRPMAHHDLRASWLNGELLTFEHNVSAAETDYRHGIGDAYSAQGFDTGQGQINQAIFAGSVTFRYDFAQKQLNLVETVFGVPTCSWRSIYSGTAATSNEIFVDELAREMGIDEVAFRLAHHTDARAQACLQHVADAGGWGAALPAGHALGVAVHVEYRSAVAYLVEIDASNPANPRLARAFAAADLGVPINPRGVEAQLQGVLIDAWSAMFRAGNHLENGRIAENNFGNFSWARISHAPPTTEVYVFPAASGDPSPGGCGELGFPAAAAACVNAYARATGTVRHRFPILEYL
jgi:isoquinoline 1-oxidoreductase beta subunit